MPFHELIETDLIPTSGGDLKITFLGHGSLYFTFQNQYIYIDPYSKVADYTKLPKADLILITHEHSDHLDLAAIASIRDQKTTVVLSEACAARLTGGIVMHNGDERPVNGIPIQAVPAYNIVHTREDGMPFHPKGVGNGYVLTFGDRRVYVAGDTENIPEMKKLHDIAIAFLPMNLPYTMTPEMVADAARSFHPHVLYPYHYGSTVTAHLKELLGVDTKIEVRIRRLA